MVDNQDTQEKEHIEIIRDTSKNKSGEIIEYQFDKKKDKLSEGGFGEVYKVKKKYLNQIQNSPEYALKIYNKEDLSKGNIDKSSIILSEINILSLLNHEHIVKYENSFEDNKNKYLLMEYCNKGSLESLIKSRKYLEEYEIRYYMFQVLSALQYFRKEKIVHRNLTLNNIFLKDLKTVKIGDFCFAYKESENNEKSDIICGTPGYFTPESNNCIFSHKTDIFCFGLCIYYLFGGKKLFRTTSESVDFFNYNEAIYFDKKLNFSEEAIDLLKQTITTENERIDLDKIYNHPFFNGGKGLTKDKFPEYKEDNNNKDNFKDFIKKLKELPNKEGLILTYKRKVNINISPFNIQNIILTKNNKTSEQINLKNNKNQLNSDESLEESDSDNSSFNQKNKNKKK